MSSDKHTEATEQPPMRICSACRWSGRRDVEECPACGMALFPSAVNFNLAHGP